MDIIMLMLSVQYIRYSIPLCVVTYCVGLAYSLTCFKY